MNKLWILLLCTVLSLAMQPQKNQYKSATTSALAQLLNRDGFSEMKSAEIQKVLTEIRELVNTGADPNVRPPFQMYTPLIFAIDYYDPNLIKLLLNKGASIQFQSSARINPLDFALKKRNIEAVNLLLDSIDMNSNFANNEPLLINAIRYREDLVPVLLTRGVDLKTKRKLQVGPPALPQNTEVEIDPLGLAILLNKTKPAQLLIKAGANVNQVYYGNRTPLMWAVARNNTDIVESLLDHGAWETIDVRNSQGKTALDIAREKRFVEIEKLLKTQKLN